MVLVAQENSPSSTTHTYNLADVEAFLESIERFFAHQRRRKKATFVRFFSFCSFDCTKKSFEASKIDVSSLAFR